MRKIWLIIKREYVTRIKTKGFVFGTIAGPSSAIGYDGLFDLSSPPG